jgi:hypothetical protein
MFLEKSFLRNFEESISSLKRWLELEPKELYEWYPANDRQRMELWVLVFLNGMPEQPASACRRLDIGHKIKAISGCLILPLR